MKLSSIRDSWQDGFTLVEIIVTLIVSALLGTILVTLMGGAVQRSSQMVVDVQAGTALQQVMERMTADYRWVLLTQEDPLNTFKSRVAAGNNSENTPYYGDYSVVTKFIAFDSNFKEKSSACTPGESDCRTLKVTLTVADQSLAALFTN
jgi:prepilin-type N-terminal cleavage/methylation domain-containing protein